MTQREAAEYWVKRQCFPVAVPHRKKAPAGHGWNAKRAALADVAKDFADGPGNIGLLLGVPYGLADVDLDCAEAISAARELAPETGLIFGRASKPASHRLYYSAPPVRTRRYLDPSDKACLAELRGLKADGTVGCQTIVPPSVHEHGEDIRFEPGRDQTPANIDGAELVGVVEKIAAAALLARHWPPAGHGRHEAEMALSGVLARAGWSLDAAEQFVVATYRAVLDHDRTKLGRVRQSVLSSFERNNSSLPVTAYRTLVGNVEARVVRAAMGWLGITVATMEGNDMAAAARAAAAGVAVAGAGAGAAGVGAAPAAATHTNLESVIETFRRWLYLPDATPLLAVLGTVAANLLPGDPVWLLLIGPPGGGKTELLQPLGGLPNVHMTSTLTEASLLSGTPSKDRAKDASGGLLRSVGDFGVLLCKDFGSVLSMNRDSRTSVLAALREVYDGVWTRHVGVDGGRTLHWQGKVGLIGACTSTIDSHHAVIAAMGERFIMFRLQDIGEDELAGRALDHQGSEVLMRAELSQAVSGLFSGLTLSQPAVVQGSERERLIALATLTVRCRSAVERDGYTRQVELIPQSEAPGRLALCLSRLLDGMTTIGASRVDAWRVVAKCAVDCVPALRLRVLGMLAGALGAVETNAVATAIRYPGQTTKRALEDLTAHGVVRRVGHAPGRGGSDIWCLTDWTFRKCEAAEIRFPEMSVEDGAQEMSEGE